MRLPALLLFCIAAAAAPALAAETWESVGLCGGGGMFSLVISPANPADMMLSCNMSEAFTSRDAGRTWQMTNHAMLRGNTRCAGAFDPKVPGRAVASGGWSNELCVTTDGGRTWRPYGKGRPWQGALRLLAIDPDVPARLFVGTESGAWMTADDGQTWQRCEGVTGRILGVVADRPASGRLRPAGRPSGSHPCASIVFLEARFRPGGIIRGCGRRVPPGRIAADGGPVVENAMNRRSFIRRGAAVLPTRAGKRDPRRPGP